MAIAHTGGRVFFSAAEGTTCDAYGRTRPYVLTANAAGMNIHRNRQRSDRSTVQYVSPNAPTKPVPHRGPTTTSQLRS